mmetsp:Transcript_96108/g.165726  ORF Transcript_96108/g.165726 Transcript_96108/m.165726 type:complete len:81 (+) Transcript_96108:478-720(+)
MGMLTPRSPPMLEGQGGVGKTEPGKNDSLGTACNRTYTSIAQLNLMNNVDHPISGYDCLFLHAPCVMYTMALRTCKKCIR